MTSPLSSLGKIRRMPLQLQTPGKRTAPFKESIQNEDEAAMMDEILGPRAQIPISRPSCSDGTAEKPTALGSAPNDMELMASMMQKIASLEQSIKSQARAIYHKDKKIEELEEQIKILKKGKAESSWVSRAEELEVICLKLQHQVWEMELFLNDYGLIWVGEGTDSLGEVAAQSDERSELSKRYWKPGESIVSETNFDLIFANLKDLNALAGEGMSQIEHTAGGARLKQLDSIPLTFYQNGIVMFQGPFRSYEEPSTQQLLRDIMDGYFPSELQKRYPDGTPFQVTDKRDTVFQERKLQHKSFPGQGHVIGLARPSGLKETNEIPGPKLTMEQFLNKLPKSRIQDGQVIDIRGEIKKTLQGSGGKSHEVIVVETPSIEAMKKRLEGNEKKKASDPNVATLRIKSENGEKTYIIKMPFTETIGDLRQHLAQSRGEEMEPYEIISTFPYRVYNNNFMTLEECGLVPNASLRLQKRAPSTKSQGQQV
ncbi:UBX domain-containing protein 11 isoform X1 [Podarcis raffonei]|uniref:UBX domain-containing protein 11 isoform X1 n=1 Tax=Podarcis raffonei TaxID=65483 RepID=UPI0023291C70|nr:UBX domain-containing protein 11 isoform X1 [Podarcis raffonei]XP_053254679.1 UBX domain-containing protein 11 isoform X1 [Podarcis raffonei]